MDSKRITGRKDVVLTLAKDGREFTARVRVPKDPRKGIQALRSFLRGKHPAAHVVRVSDVVTGGAR